MKIKKVIQNLIGVPIMAVVWIGLIIFSVWFGFLNWILEDKK